jgi:hypothetical protein
MQSKRIRLFLLICSSLLILAVTAFSQTSPIRPLPAATVSPVLPETVGLKATIAFAGKTPLKVRSKRGHFPLMGIRPGEVADIELQFPLLWANTTLIVQPPDGGKLFGNSNTTAIAANITAIALDGSAAFRFQAGDQPGLYRVSIIGGGGNSTMKFWVADPQKPRANPPVLNAGN